MTDHLYLSVPSALCLYPGTSLCFAQSYFPLTRAARVLCRYAKGLEQHPNDVSLNTGIARMHMMMNNIDKGVFMYKRVRRPPPPPLLCLCGPFPFTLSGTCK